MAGILMGGIISDTLMLKSPTSTRRDKQALDALSKITGIQPEKLTEEVFKIGSLIAQLSPQDAISADKKNFNTDKSTFSISQLEEISFEQFKKKKKQLLKCAQKLLEDENLDFFGLLVTDISKECSIMLSVGNDEILSALPFRKIEENLYDLPKILSRKKQLLPMMLKIMSDLEQ
jgi:manganese-dependent inorganic pyrophosphatase